MIRRLITNLLVVLVGSACGQKTVLRWNESKVIREATAFEEALQSRAAEPGW
jgi:hypothetical protein